MATWEEVERDTPELAAAARERFGAHRHALLATLRADGSPRLSGIETSFRDGQLSLGMMPGSRKVDDLRRDPRLALHSNSPDPDDNDPGAWAGDAKIAARAVEITDPAAKRLFAGAQAQMPPGDFVLFRLDVVELTVIRVGDPPDHLDIDTWSQGRGVRHRER